MESHTPHCGKPSSRLGSCAMTTPAMNAAATTTHFILKGESYVMYVKKRLSRQSFSVDGSQSRYDRINR